MPETSPNAKKKLTLLLDPDKLGLVVAAFLATIVMGCCFFYRRMSGFDVAVRVGVAFALCYCTTFLLVWCLRHIAAVEFAEQTAQEDQEETDVSGEAPERSDGPLEEAGSAE